MRNTVICTILMIVVICLNQVGIALIDSDKLATMTMFIYNIMFFVITKNVYNKSLREKKVKYVVFIIISILNYIIVIINDEYYGTLKYLLPLGYYIIAIILKKIDEFGKINNHKKFILITLIVFFIFEVIIYMISDFQDYNTNCVEMQIIFEIGIILITYKVSQKYYVENRKYLIVIATILFLIIGSINTYNIVNCINLQKIQKQMLSILEENNNIKNKKEIEKLLENILEIQYVNEDIVEFDYEKIPVVGFDDYKSYLGKHDFIIRQIEDLMENLSKYNVNEVKNILAFYERVLIIVIEYCQEIIGIMTYIIILDIVCISIVIFNKKRISDYTKEE